MNNAAAAPAATTAPVTRTGQESKEDTMITTAAAVAALEAIEAEVAALMGEDDEAFDEALAARHEAAIAQVRAARVRAIHAAPSDRWLVIARNLDTRRSLRVEVTAADVAGARELARGHWAAKRFLIDSITLVTVEA